MQKFIFIGNLTRDPELTQNTSGVSLCRFTVAVNRSYTNSDGERQADFFNCTAWRGLADNIARYTKKGSKVAVTGSVQMRQYEGNDGVKRNAVDVIVQDVEFLNTRNSEENAENGREIPRESKPPRKPIQQRMQSFDDDGDIPF